MLFVCVICSVVILDSSSTVKVIYILTRSIYSYINNDDDGDGLIY